MPARPGSVLLFLNHEDSGRADETVIFKELFAESREWKACDHTPIPGTIAMTVNVFFVFVIVATISSQRSESQVVQFPGGPSALSP
jgi:hypothetical protein